MHALHALRARHTAHLTHVYAVPNPRAAQNLTHGDGRVSGVIFPEMGATLLQRGLPCHARATSVGSVRNSRLDRVPTARTFIFFQRLHK